MKKITLFLLGSFLVGGLLSAQTVTFEKMYDGSYKGVHTKLSDVTQTETVIRLSCDNPETVYSVKLPATTTMYEFSSPDGSFFYSPSETGFISNYRTHSQNTPYWCFDKSGALIGAKTLYFKSSSMATIEITYWYK